MISKIKMLFGSFLFLCFTAIGGSAWALDPVNTGFFNNVTIDGYDATAYFKNEKPAEGSSEFSHKWKGVQWHFTSAEARDEFIANPVNYAPQYGGYCSNQMSLGNVHDSNPEVWLIHKKKLYLFGANMGRDRWNQNDLDQMVKDADANWHGKYGQK